MQRTPPSPSKTTLMQGQSLSEPDLPSASTCHKPGEINITVRSKRQRVEYSPNKETDFEFKPALEVFKSELQDMLTKWKTEHDQLLTTWKTDHDAILYKLVSDVSELKTQLLSVQTMNTEMDRSMNYINEKHEDIIGKVVTLEKQITQNDECMCQIQKQIQDLQYQTRQATIEIRNIPVKETENTEDLIATVKNVGKALNRNIDTLGLRDIYRLPGKPGLCRPIVAEFRCVNTRNDFLSAARKFNKERSLHDKLNTQSIGIEGDKKPVYVDEHLPSTVKKLLYETRQFAKVNNYSSWYSNGRILLRKDPAEKPLVIKSEKCLSNLSSKQ